VAQNIQYLNCEPGDTIFKQGDFGDKYFIILKGKIQVQIPDPLGTGLIEPKIIKQEIVEEEEVIEEDKNIKLTK
jgi:CRP-like cAMP-binding protein